MSRTSLVRAIELSRGHADPDLARGNLGVDDDRAGARARARADVAGRHEHGPRAEERVRADRRLLLRGAVPVGEDRPGADVRALSDLRVADVSEVERARAV